jgi:hypothetical protein
MGESYNRMISVYSRRENSEVGGAIREESGGG